jgi:hypothetical protein
MRTGSVLTGREKVIKNTIYCHVLMTRHGVLDWKLNFLNASKS